MQTLIQDLRYSVRQLIKSPGFTLTAVISLALGIGATTAVFSVIYAALMDPYPFPAADRIVRMSVRPRPGSVETVNLNVPQIQQLRQVRADRERAGHGLPRHDDDRPRPAGECERHRPDLERLRRSGRAAGAGAGTLALGRDRWAGSATGGGVVLQVLAGAFRRGPARGGEDAATRPEELHDRGRCGAAVQVVQRGCLSAAEADAGSGALLHRRFPPAAGRDARGGRRRAGTAAGAVCAGTCRSIFRSTSRCRWRGSTSGWREAWAERCICCLARWRLLLAIGCGNVSILLLAQGTARQHEFAVRAAVGAHGRRIVRQLLTESMLLAAIGVALGVLASYGILAGIKAVLPRFAFAPEVVIRINLPVLFFSACVALATALLFGLWPALQLSRTQGARSWCRTRAGWREACAGAGPTMR